MTNTSNALAANTFRHSTVINFTLYAITEVPNFEHLLNVPQFPWQKVLSSYTFFQFSNEGRICLITINIIENGDIGLEIVNYSKTSLVEVRYTKVGPNFDHYIYFSPYSRNNVRQTTLQPKRKNIGKIWSKFFFTKC